MDTRGTFFREIHKNTWLKRLSAEGKKFSTGNKKSERNWVVFCVHNDTEALLEGYCEPRLAASHNPDWIIPLQSTQHISHSLVPNEQEYEFVITLNDEVVRFHTFSWEIMQEWVSTLRSKLRELRILSPKENLYTKLPEVRFPLLPTRDPTSPLPATPLVPPVNVPGVEHVSPLPNGLQRESAQTSGPSSCNSRTNSDHRPVQFEDFDNREETVEDRISENNEETSISTNNQLLQNNSQPSLRLSSKNDSALISCGENSVKVDITLANKNTSQDIEISDILPASKYSLTNTGESTIPAINRISNKNEMESEGNTQNNAASMLKDTLDEIITNITIIQVSNSFLVDDASSRQSGSSIQSEFKSNVEIVPSELKSIPEVLNRNQSSCCNHVKKSNMAASLNEVTTVHIPGFLLANSYGSVCPSQSSKLVKNEDKIFSTSLSGITNITIGNEYTEENNELKNTAFALNSPISIANNTQNNIASINSAPSNMLVPISQGINAQLGVEKYIEASTSNKCLRGTANTSSSHDLARPSTSSGLVADEAKNCNNINQLRLDQSKKIVCSPTKSKPSFTRGLSEAVISARPSRIDQKNLKSRTHNSPIHTSTKFDPLQHRRCSSTSVSRTQNNESEDRDGKQLISSQTRSSKESAIAQPIKPLTLREQQVLFLKREIMHPGGIRLQLRRKDCLGSIAWIDAFGAIWVAGWKQKEHPMLYNALHIGDQLISIGQTIVINADEASKIIRNSNTLFLEILIRRVPFGRIYAIRRETEGQCLGLIRDGNTATIVDVVPNSLAARHGLPPRVKSCDGLCLAFWVLTEVNGRPLNLFFKENEVRDRLNSVGRDISILVQPSDLILKLKKQLKSLRSYKDYIVQ